MTRQIDDVVYYRGKPYSLADLAGTRPVVPEEYRISHRSTGCWRGFTCTYEVADNVLFVTRQPSGLRRLIPFTGAMLLADDYIQDLWGMITPDAYKYREVHELVFQDGRLVEEHERSGKVAEFRQMLSACDSRESSAPSIEEVALWVKRSFSREYEEFVRDYKSTELVSRVRGRTCDVCGRVIDLFRLCGIPNTKRCLPCQIAFETEGIKACPRCSKPLRSKEAKECFECGADWH
jgi:RNA polymerase-binding transcription factor DksA